MLSNNNCEYDYLVELSKGNTDLYKNDPHYGLFSVFDSEEIFKVPELTENEQNDHLLFTKNHKMKNYKTGDKVINSKQEFEKYFDLITNNVFLCMDWNNVLIAGGAILSLISKVPEKNKISDESIQEWYRSDGNFGDIDIFLYGLSEREATKKIFEIYESIKKVIPKDILCVRGPRAITFVMGNPYRHIQIILRNFKTMSEVLLSFDIDSCAFGYDGNNVWCSNRSHYAITHCVNTVNINKKSSSYEYRLSKYGKRGYAVSVPNFTEENLNEQIYLKQPHQLKGLAKLLVLEKLDDNVKFQIYRDVLDLHQASMRKNLNYKTEYEDSDYSKIYLPDWTENFTLQQIEKIMEQKHNRLNNISTTAGTTTTATTGTTDANIKYYCFYGKLNDVIMGKPVKMPQFETNEQRYNYERSFVHGRLKFVSISDKEFKELGVFNASCLNITPEDINQWYQTAYYESTTNKNTIIECVVNSNPEKLVEVIENGKIGKTDDEYLIWKKKMINVRDIANRTPLHQAVLKQDECMILLLLDYGADLSYVSKLGKTPLHTACEIGSIDIVKLLMESEQIKNNNSLINIQDSYKLTPILYALMYGNIEVFKFLYKYVDNKDLVWIYKHDKTKSYRALKMCLIFRQYEIAKFLLKKKYDINDYYSLLKQSSKTNKSNKYIHILEESVKLFDFQMFNILIDHHLSHDDSGLTYKIEKLYNLSSILQHKYNNAKNNQSCDYYASFITKLYILHGNKNSLYELLACMIKLNKFDEFKKYVNENEVNLMLVGSNGESLLDIVENQIQTLKTNATCKKNTVRKIQENSENVTKYKYSTNILEYADKKFYVVPSWIIETELYHGINIKSEKNKISEFEKEIDLMNESIEYFEKVKKYLTNKGVVSFIKKSQIKEKTSVIKNNISSTDVQNINIQIVSSCGKNIYDQQIYFELFDDIYNGNNLNDYELSEIDFGCYLSKSKLTPLHVSLLYENHKAFTTILDHIMKNKKNIVFPKKKQIIKNNLKLFKKTTQDNNNDNDNDDVGDMDSNSETENNQNDVITYLIDWDFTYGLIKIISNSGVIRNLSHFLNETFEIPDIFKFVSLYFWKIINCFILEKSYNLIYEIIDYFDSKELEIPMTSSDLIISNVFDTNDIEGVSAVFKAIKSCKNYYSFNDDILVKYIIFVNSQETMKKSKVANKVVKSIVELCPSIINKKVNGSYPVIFASKGKTFLLDIILGCYPDMNVFDDDQGHSAIHTAIINNNSENVRLILTNCPEHINLQTLTQLKTPLMLVSVYYTDIVDLVLSYNPDEDLVDIFGNTALHYGTIKANMYMIDKLKYHDRENYMRMTPSDYIINNYKSYFHHIRNDKSGLQLEKKKMSFIVEIYKKYILGKSRERINASYADVVKVNKYILNSIPEGVNEIPDILKI